MSIVYVEPDEFVAKPRYIPRSELARPVTKACRHSRASLSQVGPDLVTVECDDCDRVWKECGIVNPALLRKAGL
jgi:hypothetical protein